MFTWVRANFETSRVSASTAAKQLTSTGTDINLKRLSRLEASDDVSEQGYVLPPPRQNAVRMSKELSFRSVTHFRLRNEIIGKQIKLPHREVQNQKVRLRKEK